MVNSDSEEIIGLAGQVIHFRKRVSKNKAHRVFNRPINCDEVGKDSALIPLSLYFDACR